MARSQSTRPVQTGGLDWRVVVALTPLALIFLGFFLMPIAGMLITSLQSAENRGSGASWTMTNYSAIGNGVRRQAFVNSVELSALAATIAAGFGLLVAAGLSQLKSRKVDEVTGIISSVLANSGGAPLAFSFVVLLGNVGYLTPFISRVDPSFSLYSVRGLVVMYQYFLIPTMVLLVLPSLKAIKTSWKEANTSLGGSPWMFWRRVGGPILLPTVLGAWVMLFGASFATHACAAVLMGTGAFPLATLQIGGELASSASSGGENVAMAMGIATTVVAVLVLVVFNWLQERSQRWLM